MTTDDRPTEDSITDLMGEEIRKLCGELATERRQKSEVLERYDRMILEQQELRTRIALLEAELAHLQNGRPVESREVRVLAFEHGLAVTSEELERQRASATMEFFAGMP